MGQLEIQYHREYVVDARWRCDQADNIVSGLVIFYCTLLSLRGHDDGKVVTKIQDYELAGEKELYGG